MFMTSLARDASAQGSIKVEVEASLSSSLKPERSGSSSRSVYSFFDADVTGTREGKGKVSFLKTFKDCNI